jgi:hypothetical protein
MTTKTGELHLDLINGNDYRQLQLPEIRSFIDPILGEGVTVLAAKAKTGKSILSTQLAIALVTGRPAFDSFPTKKTNVLYLNYEESPQTFQSRIKNNSDSSDDLSGLLIPTQCPEPKNLIETLDQELTRNPNIGVVILDTLFRAVGNDITKSRNYQNSYDAINKLRDCTKVYDISILCIHHTTKNIKKDDISSTYGSMGLLAAVDGVMLLSDDKFGLKKLYNRSRNSCDQTLSLRLEDARFSIVDDNSTPGLPDEQNKIKKIIDNSGKMTLSDICQATSKKPNTVSKSLNSLIIKGEILKVARGVYASTGADHQTQDTDTEIELPMEYSPISLEAPNFKESWNVINA